MSEQGAAPSGDVFEWYSRGRELLEAGDAAAAAQVLRHAVAADVGNRGVRELFARALFDSRAFAESAQQFGVLVREDPGSDYALFGLGLAESRTGAFELSARHLAMAAAMRPDLPHYVEALRQVRATLRAREQAAGMSADEVDEVPADVIDLTGGPPAPSPPEQP